MTDKRSLVDYAASAAETIGSKQEAEQLRKLLEICQYLSTEARGLYRHNQPVTVLGETQLGALNECQNRILGYVLALLHGQERYPLAVLMKDVFRQAEGAGVHISKMYERIVTQPGLN
jgi:hypothetical protein